MFIFQTHLWDDATPIEETLRTLDDLVRCGKVRYTGACNLVGWQPCGKSSISGARYNFSERHVH
jgi:aryl-alcohol dehydrogenase-like predicted oxidoreductase